MFSKQDAQQLAMQIRECSSFSELHSLASYVGLVTFNDLHVSLALQAVASCIEYLPSGQASLGDAEGRFADALLDRGGELAHSWTGRTLASMLGACASLGRAPRQPGPNPIPQTPNPQPQILHPGP